MANKIIGNKNVKIPITTLAGIQLDPKKARAIGEDFSNEYCFADPYPHIIIDDFLPHELANEVLDNFPTSPIEGDKFFKNGYAGLNKRQTHPTHCNEKAREIFSFLNSASMLQFLEGITTIQGLIPDPYFSGGGFHEIRNGGKLGIHADFRINQQLHLNRRLNMLIYLNKDWQESYGGNLEIWDRSMSQCCALIAPIFNRCVIFNTESDSYHGHPDPLNIPDNITRKSIALYYYTASKHVYNESPSHSTMFVARPNDSANIKSEVFRLRVDNYLKDFLPPIVFRMLIRVRGRIHLMKKILKPSSETKQ